MPFSEELQERLIARIAEQLPEIGACSVCRTDRWELGSGLVKLVLTEDPNNLPLAGPTLPSLPLVCLQCGNTLLLNVFVLGVADLLGVKRAGQSDDDAAAPASEMAEG